MNLNEKLGIITTLLVYTCLNCFILNQVNKYVKEPYMDEIFHVPQAENYCLGNYHVWNDKITTLPGLYILTTTPLRLVSIMANIYTNRSLLIQQLVEHKRLPSMEFFSTNQTILDGPCSLVVLRFSNILMHSIAFILIYLIQKEHNIDTLKHSKYQVGVNLLNTLVLSMFPLNYFFQFMYYTDTGSTMFVLFAYYFYLKNGYWLSALCGLVAFVFRQTNFIWLVFLLGQIFLYNMEAFTKRHINKNHKYDSKHSCLFDWLCRTPTALPALTFSDATSSLVQQLKIRSFIKLNLVTDLIELIVVPSIKPYALAIGACLLFFFVNGGLVVGDKLNHEATLHLCQLFYFVTFASAFTFGSMFVAFRKKLTYLIQFLRRSYLVSFILLLICLVIANFTYEHLFIISDNRHYTFYLWAKLFRKHEALKFIYSFVYLVAAYIFFLNLAFFGTSKKTYGWLILFTASTSLCLVPQKLVEFRYFILPFLFYRFNVSYTHKCVLQSSIELIFYILVNAITLNIYLTRTFMWPHDTQLQRFMW